MGVGVSTADDRGQARDPAPSYAVATIKQAETIAGRGMEDMLTRAAKKVGVEKSGENQGSQQLPPDAEAFQFLEIQEQIIEPPINLKLWAAQLARSTRLNRGIRTIARNTVGIGFEIVPVEPFNDDTPEEEKRRIGEQTSQVKSWFRNLNPEQPFEALMECVSIDEEATGNGYLEFTRTGDGALDRAFHVPSVTVRILRRNRGFVQIRGGQKRFFKRFGDDRVMDARNGKFQDEVGFNRPDSAQNPGTVPLAGESRDAVEGDVLPLEHRATEIFHFKLYHPMSDVYGLPRFISAAAAITGNWLASKRNVVFFKNDAVPRMAVIVTGGKLTQASQDDLAAYLQEGQGEEQAHRLLILQAEEEGVGLDGKSTSKIDLKPMTVGVTEDGSFLNYRLQNDEEIREALGLSEVFFKSNKLTKASAVVAKATTDEQEFEPARKQKEHRLNQQVIWGPLGLQMPDVKILFKRPDTTDALEQARVDKLYSDAAVMTPNELRRNLGLDPYPPEHDWANLPLPVLILALKEKAGALLPKLEMDDNDDMSGDEPPPDTDDDAGEPADEGDDDDNAPPAEPPTPPPSERSIQDPLARTKSITEAIRSLSR